MTQSLLIDPSVVKRIQQLRTDRNAPDLRLRVTVDSGGCSGFQYILALEEGTQPDDHVFSGVVVTDEVSLPFLEGALVAFKTGLAGAEFTIDNPNAVSGCGCGSSFSMG